MSDLAELRRLAEAANADAVQGATYERDWPLSSRAVGQFLRALNPDLALDLLDAAAERDEIAGRLAALLCDLTGGRLSKTTYPVPVMVQEIERHLSECHESDLRAERDALAAKLDRVRALHEPGRKFTRPGGHDQFCACGLQHPCPTIRALDESGTDR